MTNGNKLRETAHGVILKKKKVTKGVTPILYQENFPHPRTRLTDHIAEFQTKKNINTFFQTNHSITEYKSSIDNSTCTEHLL